MLDLQPEAPTLLCPGLTLGDTYPKLFFFCAVSSMIFVKVIRVNYKNQAALKSTARK